MSDVVVKKVPHCNICRHPGERLKLQVVKNGDFMVL